jgi:mannose-1-phosphate guanylyltransferase
VLRAAGGLASRHSAPVTIGVRPTRPETGFGYITPGARLFPAVAGPAWMSEFYEKPPRPRAEALIDEGALWNAGILVGEAGVILDALAAHTPEIAPGLAPLARGDVEGFTATITEGASIERALLERLGGARRALVIPGEFGWDDVGTWASLRRARDLDDNGNGARGRVHFVDASANVVHSEAGTVVLYGVSQLLVVALDGLTFVTTLDKARDLKPLLDALPESMRLKPTEL